MLVDKSYKRKDNKNERMKGVKGMLMLKVNLPYFITVNIVQVPDKESKPVHYKAN